MPALLVSLHPGITKQYKKMQKVIINLFLIVGFTINFHYSLHADPLTDSSIQGILKGPQDILPADESFKFSAFLQEDRIILTWELKENCFLYKDKFLISSLPEENLQINTSQIPVTILDEYFGEVEVFFNKVTKSFVRNPLIQEISLKYQGCNEKGFCYPVINKQLVIKNEKILIYKGT